MVRFSVCMGYKWSNADFVSFLVQHYPIEKLAQQIFTSTSPMTESLNREGCDNY